MNRAIQICACLFAMCCGDLAHAQEDESSSRTMTIELRKTITMQKRVGGCEAKLAIEYWQKGDMADVQMVLSNEECAASHGEFSIEVRVRNDEGELSSDSYAEVWSRSDDQPVTISRLYPIGDDVDLIRVRSNGLSCECDNETDEPGRDQ